MCRALFSILQVRFNMYQVSRLQQGQVQSNLPTIPLLPPPHLQPDVTLHLSFFSSFFFGKLSYYKSIIGLDLIYGSRLQANCNQTSLPPPSSSPAWRSTLPSFQVIIFGQICPFFRPGFNMASDCRPIPIIPLPPLPISIPAQRQDQEF